MLEPAEVTSPARSRRTRVTANLLVAGVSLLLSLAAAELVARRLERFPTPPFPAARFEALGLVRNTQNFRDFEFSFEKPPGTFRIVALGDSFTEGQGVNFDDIWPKRLERYLNEYRRVEGVRYEVINLAISGTSTPRELEILRERGLAYHPDLVVIGYCLNDAEDEGVHRIARVKPHRMFKDYGSSGPVGGWLTRHSALYRLVIGRLRNAKISSWTLEYYRTLYRPGYEGWKETRAALKGFGRIKKRQGLPVVVMLFPLFSWDFDDRYPLKYAHEAVRKAADAARLPLLDLLPFYRGLDHRELEAVPGRDSHPSDVADRIAAQELLVWLDERGMLPPRPAPRVPPLPLPPPY